MFFLSDLNLSSNKSFQAKEGCKHTHSHWLSQTHQININVNGRGNWARASQECFVLPLQHLSNSQPILKEVNLEKSHAIEYLFQLITVHDKFCFRRAEEATLFFVSQIPWWKEKTNFPKLSSDLHTHVPPTEIITMTVIINIKHENNQERMGVWDPKEGFYRRVSQGWDKQGGGRHAPAVKAT